MSIPPPEDPSALLPTGQAPISGSSSPTGSPVTRGRRSSNGLVMVCALVAALVGAVVGGLVAHLADTSGTTTTAAGSGAVCDARAVASSVLPSVVTIAVRGTTESGSGSGEVIKDSGYLLTNDHVIAAGADGGRIDVLFSDGTSRPATITGRSPQFDLAVLKVQTTVQLPVITLGDSDTVAVGQPVVALGAPLGLDGSVTAGIVSALGRDIVVPADGGLTARIPGGLQTDASINPGNSGGALVDCTRSSGRGQHGDRDRAQRQRGRRWWQRRYRLRHPHRVGLGGGRPAHRPRPVHPADHRHLHRSRSRPGWPRSSAMPAGLYVRALDQGGPGAQAGMAVGDVIVTIDGAPADHGDALVEATLTRRAGDQLTLGYMREGTAGTATVTLAAGS